jgi:6,7-dimethyl-8-ribityllumazine synthase
VKPRTRSNTRVSGRPIGRVAVVASRYHEEITSKLVAGAKRAAAEFKAAGVDVLWVEGAYELPQAARLAALSGRYEAVVPIGCVIRGETSHFKYIARAVAVGLDAAGRDTGVPVSFGVLTVDDRKQARARAGGKLGNKGEEAARAALSLALLTKELSGHGKPAKSARTGAPGSLPHRPR